MRFLKSPRVSSLHHLTSRVMLDGHGVKCSDLCSPAGTLFGLVGFCTRDYCRCAGDSGWASNGWEEWEGFRGIEEESCPPKQVFDPVTLQCAHPAHTILCSDRPKTYERHSYSWGWSG
jgi:hypothetical protein